MTRHSRLAAPTLFATTLLLSIIAAGCGGSSGGGSTTTAARAELTLGQLVTSDAPIRFHANVASIRQSPYYETVVTLLRGAIPEREAGDAQTIVNLLEQTDHLHAGLFMSGNRGMIAMRGRFSEADLDRIEAPRTSTLIRQHAIRGDDEVSFVVLGSDTLLFGAPADIAGAVDRFDRVAPATGPNLAGFEAAAARVGFESHDMSAVIMLTEEVRRQFGRGQLEETIRDHGVAAGIAINVRDGLQVDAFFEAGTTGAIQYLAGVARDLLAEARQDMMLAALGIAALLQQVEIEEQGTTLNVTFALDDQQVRDVLERFEPILDALVSGL